MPFLYILIFIPYLIPLAALWALLPRDGRVSRHSRAFWAGLGILITGIVSAKLAILFAPDGHLGFYDASRELVVTALLSSASYYTCALLVLVITAVWAKINLRTAKSTATKNYQLIAQIFGIAACLGTAMATYLLVTGPPPTA